MYVGFTVVAALTVPEVVPEAVQVWPPELKEVGTDQVVPASNQTVVGVVDSVV